MRGNRSPQRHRGHREHRHREHRHRELRALCACVVIRLLAVVVAIPAFAQQSAVFPRFSILAGKYAADFTTDVRVDPEGTSINLERDLGLDRSQRVNDYAVRWRPLARHELAGSYVSSSR